jgi:hypothetical protein
LPKVGQHHRRRIGHHHHDERALVTGDGSSLWDGGGQRSRPVTSLRRCTDLANRSGRRTERHLPMGVPSGVVARKSSPDSGLAAM